MRRSAVYLGIILLFMLLAGGYFLFHGRAESPPLVPFAERPPFRLVVLGDSLSAGYGDESGKGYAGNLKDHFEKKRDRPVELVNFGVNGLRSEGLLASLGRNEVTQALSAASHVVISIGGNDVFRGEADIGGVAEAVMQKRRADYERNLQAILSRIRALNDAAPVRLIEPYNPFGGTPLQERAEGERALLRGITAKEAAAFSGVALVSVGSLEPAALAEDRFHPNREGYRRIADKVYQSFER
ncbi:hypothetical protein GTO89_05915 [Heliobacterium gestii]|uniref:SGNH hydrolase-type esterase domain-containing protein n=1 Tax=Heliomicrobium gestii TaxID=2699 RepID=A0A845L7I8_HELGE|nr:GDSL-type esterase/lipase family protein [Heliomicrobium gestii]MBM7866101.1 lysophospholipase L1-like esterase [Heliomicrobium gestii]MZP42572.1 hypothetical protein [Heliomicrobium gestii]